MAKAPGKKPAKTIARKGKVATPATAKGGKSPAASKSPIRPAKKVAGKPRVAPVSKPPQKAAPPERSLAKSKPEPAVTPRAGKNPPRGQPPAAQSRPARSERPARHERSAREERPPREERLAREERPAREERSAGDERPSREGRAARADRPARASGADKSSGHDSSGEHAANGKPVKLVSPFSARDLENFRTLLLAKRHELIGDMSAMEREALRGSGGSNLSNLPIHMADMGTDNYEQEFTLGLVQKDRDLLKEINVALSKIQSGTYGLCEGTGEPINKERLEYQPWARYSVEYQRKREQHRR